jgi:hypothetical protein
MLRICAEGFFIYLRKEFFMKNKLKLKAIQRIAAIQKIAGITACAAVIWFSMAALSLIGCDPIDDAVNNPNPPTPTVIGVTVVGYSVIVKGGEGVTFTATVFGTNNPDQGVE